MARLTRSRFKTFRWPGDNRGAVMPGMLVKHREGTWTASANKRGRLYLHRGIERTYTTDLLVEVYLNGLGQGLSR
ncbi:cell division inhibitor protein [Salmonella enterica subsp. enterica]|nr:cell division inhibitor protein [Salmonella enterica subsp. enterica]